MRLLHLLPPSLLAILATPTSAFEIPYITSLSLPISLQDYISPAFATNTSVSNPTSQPAGDLRRRQGNGCPNDFHACSNLGAPGLCCANAAVCTPDGNGNPACCPSNAVCTGLVSGAITSGTVNSEGSLVTGGTAAGGGGGATTSAASGSAGQATTTGGVVIQSNTASNSAASSRAVVIGGGGGGGGGNGGNTGSGAMRNMEVVSTRQPLIEGTPTNYSSSHYL